MTINSDLEQLLEYVKGEETDRLKQQEWKDVAKKHLPPKPKEKWEGWKKFDYVGVEGTYTFICDYVENNGIPPTLREIRDAVDITSLRGVTLRLDKLQKQGLLYRVGKNSSRNIVIDSDKLKQLKKKGKE